LRRGIFCFWSAAARHNDSRMDMSRLRAYWWSKQGLGNGVKGDDGAEILARVGWARSVGGANPYLTLFARGLESRESIDAQLESQAIHELPCARGCTYVVPEQHFALALKVGQGFSDAAAMNTARKFLGVTDDEVDQLKSEVLSALKDGPLEPSELRKHLGNLVRNLGEEGKKRGQTTTLPLALGFLQSEGRIRRIPVSGRIDQQRYRYAIWDPSPLAGYSKTREEAMEELASHYFKWAGPCRLDHFHWFSGLGVGASKSAIANLDLKDIGEGFLMHREDARSLSDFQVSERKSYALISSIDSLLLLRRDLQNLLEPEDMMRQMAGEKGLLSVGGLQDLANNAIVDRGRVVGIWEFDPEVQKIVWHSFVPPDAELEGAVARTEGLIARELGDCRSFSLDSPESRKPKLAAIRSLNG